MILLVNCKSGIYKNAPEENSMNQDIREIIYKLFRWLWPVYHYSNKDIVSLFTFYNTIKPMSRLLNYY